MIIFESEIFAINSKSMFPFKVVVEKNSNGSANEVVVKRIEYRKIEGKEYEETRLLMGSTWHDVEEESKLRR